MKDDSVILEAEIVADATMPNTLGGAFARANSIQAVPAAGPAGYHSGSHGPGFVEFLKPTISNLFLLGCLLGLFVLYCCSCVVHAATYPTRRKST